MRCILFSSTTFGWHCAQTIQSLPEAEIAGVVTTPGRIKVPYSDRPVKIATNFDFAAWGEEENVPVHIETKGFDPSRCARWLQDHDADLFLVLGWYFLLPRRIRTLAKKGTLGIHASLLPEYRGGAPLVWAMINGETTVGVSLFHLEDGTDDGDIVGQSSIEVSRDATIATIYEVATERSAALLREWIPRIADGTAPRIPQDHAKATTFAQRSPEDGEIDWTRPAGEIHDFIRAQTKPYPGAFTYINGTKITIWAARCHAPQFALPDAQDAPTGTISSGTASEGGIHVVCGKNTTLELIALRIDGQDSTNRQFSKRFLASGIQHFTEN